MEIKEQMDFFRKCDEVKQKCAAHQGMMNCAFRYAKDYYDLLRLDAQPITHLVLFVVITNKNEAIAYVDSTNCFLVSS